MSDTPKPHYPKSGLFEMGRFFGNLERQTHAGTAMVFSARLEKSLRLILEGHMPKLSSDLGSRLFEGYGPFASLSAKIDTAYALGLIEGKERSLLHDIRSIRNAFAHSDNPEMHFDHEDLAELMAKLPAPKESQNIAINRFAEAVWNCAAGLQQSLEAATLIQALRSSKRSKALKEKSA